MQPTDKSGPPSVSEPESTPAAGPVVVSSDSLDSLGGPASDPSDPDAAMYAAIAARPDWTTKPAARAALAELSQGLTTGQDLLFWDVHRPRDAKPSDAAEHASIAVPHQAAGQGAAGVELPSRRLYVGPAADPRRVATVRSPGRNGPRRPSAAGAEVTLVSRCGGAEGSAAEGRLPALHGDGSRVRVVRGAVATLVGSLAVALGLLGLFGVPASGPAAPLDASVSARPSSDKQAGRAVPRGADTEHASAHAAETAFVAAPALSRACLWMPRSRCLPLRPRKSSDPGRALRSRRDRTFPRSRTSEAGSSGEETSPHFFRHSEANAERRGTELGGRRVDVFAPRRERLSVDRAPSRVATAAPSRE